MGKERKYIHKEATPLIKGGEIVILQGDRHNNNFQNGKCIEKCLNKDDQSGTQSPTERQLYGENNASSMKITWVRLWFRMGT